MKEICLTQGKVAIVDDIDYEFLSQWKWRVDSGGYAVSQTSRSEGLRQTLRMHRIVMSCKLGNKFSLQVDHKNGDRLNNCRSNLRLATYSNQRANARKRTGKFKGVWWYKAYAKWQSQITCEGRRYHLGYFDNPIDAAKAYNKAALEKFGEFAKINDV